LGILQGARKNILFGVERVEISLQSPKNGIWGSKSVCSCDISIVGEFYKEQEKIYFWGTKKREKSFQSATTRGRVVSKGLCDHPYKKIKRPPKFLQKATFLDILGDCKGPRDQCRIATMAIPPFPTTELRPQKIKNKFPRLKI
jgi:hypothetical protein